MTYGDLPASYDNWLTTPPDGDELSPADIAAGREEARLDRAGL